MGTNQGGGSHDEAGEQERHMGPKEDDGQTAFDETEAAAQRRGVPGPAGEISSKTVCFNSQPEFAPIQKTLSDDEGEENRRRIPTGDLKISSPRPRSIVKSSENPPLRAPELQQDHPLPLHPPIARKSMLRRPILPLCWQVSVKAPRQNPSRTEGT